MMATEKSTMTIQFNTYQDQGHPDDRNWMACASISDDEPFVWIDRPVKSAEVALTHIKRKFFSVLACSHKFEAAGETIIQDYMGNDIDHSVYECKLCGFVDYVEIPRDE